MLPRPFWLDRLQNGWRQAPIVWLSGVRRVGKTTLAQSLDPQQVLYLNCDLPAVEDRVRDPEVFYRTCGKPTLVFDEIHQLRDPTRLLKIGADLFPKLRLLATGSSTLAASRKFRDTLTGRKRDVQLLPVLWEELPTFGKTIPERLLHGGLPPALLAADNQASFYREWIDSFFARDIQRLFGFRDINRFNGFFEYILRQSGGQFEATEAATALGITRPTVESHLRALEITHAVMVVRPFHSGGQKEIVKQPKIYGFDTGFVSFARGWDTLRPEETGILWEQFVLEQLLAYSPEVPVRYWRDKAGHEVDFVLPRRRDEVDAIECKWNPKTFDGKALEVFRGYYPKGANYLLSPTGDPPYTTTFRNLEVKVCTPSEFRPGHPVATSERSTSTKKKPR